MKQFLTKWKIKKHRARLEKYGADATELFTLAQLYRQLAQDEQARESYQEAIEAYYQAGTRVGQDNEFIVMVCWALLALDPVNELAYRTLGQEFCGSCEFEQAVELYTHFAQKLVEAMRFDDAIAQYRNALVLRPENLELHQGLLTVLWRLHRKEEVVQELKTIAGLAEKAHDHGKAIECYRNALKIRPADILLKTELARLVQRVRTMEKPLRLVVNE